MVKEFSIVSELESIREKKRRLLERESELSTPLLKDSDLIPVVHEMFKDILSEIDPLPDVESITQRKKFLLFYSYSLQVYWRVVVCLME